MSFMNANLNKWLYKPELDPDANIKLKVIREPLFSKNNPNEEIFVVPTLEGSDSEDQSHGSIGDATMEHVYAMSHRSLEMEHFVYMKDGNIFRIENNVMPSDEVGQKRISSDIMKTVTSKLSQEQKDKLVEFFQAELQEKQNNIADKQDALDQTTVSFENWETVPQMNSNTVDIPSTPKPLWIYAGNTKQVFYDYFPEGHPDSKQINQILTKLQSYDLYDINEKTIDFLKYLIVGDLYSDQNTAKIKFTEPTVKGHFLALFDALNQDNPNAEDLIIKTLQNIEEDWIVPQKRKAIKEFKQSNPIKEMVKFYEANKKDHENGELIWGRIGKLAKTLYRDKTGMTSAHWNAYMRLKVKMAPKINVGTIDINHSKFSAIYAYFKKTVGQARAEKIAKNIFFKRPFMTLFDLVNQNILVLSDLQGSQKTALWVHKIQKTNNIESLKRVCLSIREYQLTHPRDYSAEEWATLWQIYNIARQNFGDL